MSYQRRKKRRKIFNPLVLTLVPLAGVGATSLYFAIADPASAQSSAQQQQQSRDADSRPAAAAASAATSPTTGAAGATTAGATAADPGASDPNDVGDVTTSTHPAATGPATTNRASTQRAPGAQTAPSTAPAATRPGPRFANAPSTTRNGGGGGGGANTAPATLPFEGIHPVDGKYELNFKNAAIEAILDELSSRVGFVVVKQAEIHGRVNLTSAQPLDADGIVSLLNSVLRDNGLAAVRMDRELKVMTLANAKKSAIPVHYGAEPKEIHLSDELITQVIPIRHADATQLKADLTPMISNDADFSANASSNSLIMTDTSANIRRIAEVVKAIDTSADDTDLKVIPLKYASATSVATLINTVFRGEETTGGRAGGAGGGPGGGFPFAFGPGGPGGGGGGPGGGGRRGGGGGGGGAANNDNNRRGKVNASADDRTNTLVVTGPTETLITVASVVSQIDSNPVPQQSVFVYPLKNAQSADLESVINSIFSGQPGNSNRNSLNTSNRVGSTSTSSFGSNRSGGGGLGGGSSGFGSSGGGGGSFGNGGGFASNRSSNGLGSTGGFGQTGNRSTGGVGAARLTPGTANAASDLIGQVSVVADQDTNSLLVLTSPGNFKIVKSVIEELDRPVPQVLIKVLIAEVTHDAGHDIGAEFSILNIRNNGHQGSVGTNFGLANSTGGLMVQIMETEVQATIKALETAGKLDVLSRPYILASDNQLATITVGQEVPFVTNSRITDAGQTINTIQYSDVGIILDVIPHINPEGLVIMDVAPEISALTGSNVAISEQVNAPIINKRSAQSRVAIANGQTIVIGGLMEDQKTETVQKVPLLGDIPIIGAAFQRNQLTKTKTELLIFLTPHVAETPSVLPGMSRDEVNGTVLTPHAVEPGAYENHREGLQRGATELTPRPARSLTQPSDQPDADHGADGTETFHSPAANEHHNPGPMEPPPAEPSATEPPPEHPQDQQQHHQPGGPPIDTPPAAPDNQPPE